jgi:hypothetical protein
MRVQIAMLGIAALNSASYPTSYACYDMYMVRFDGSTETWATKLTGLVTTAHHSAAARKR